MLLLAISETLLSLVVVCSELLGLSEIVVDDDDEPRSKVSGVIIMLLCVSFFGNLS